MSVYINKWELREHILDGERIKVSDQEKDLGVLTSDTLFRNDQINSCNFKQTSLFVGSQENLSIRTEVLSCQFIRP